MIDVQHLIARTVGASIDTSVVEFDQDIFSEFKAQKLALLILYAVDFRVLHQLRVEFDQFHHETRDRIRVSESARPCVDVLDAAFERRRQPSFRASSVVEARLAIASLSIAAASTECAPRVEFQFDRLPTMLD